MADNTTLPGTGDLISDMETTTLNGGTVTAQKIQRVINAVKTGAATAIDITGDTANGMDVDVTRVSGDVTVVQATAANLKGTVIAAGDTAAAAADAGNPVKIGGRALSAIKTSTMLSAGNRADNLMDLDSISIAKPFTSYGDIVTERVSDTGGTSTNFSNFTAVANTKNYVTTIVAYNDSTTNGFVDFRDGSAGAVLLTLPLPAKGGAIVNFPLPFKQTTANTALAYDVSAALTTVYLTVVGFQSKA